MEGSVTPNNHDLSDPRLTYSIIKTFSRNRSTAVSKYPHFRTGFRAAVGTGNRYDYLLITEKKAMKL